MRIILFSALIVLLASCGEAERPVQSDSTPVAATTDSPAFESMHNSVMTVNLPAWISIDSIAKYKKVSVDERDAKDLLTSDFDYETYNEVYVFGESRIGNIPVLWFELTSEPEYDGSPDAVDVLMVMYDCNYKPIDVLNTTYQDAGHHSYSYVRNDSIFIVESGGQDDVEVTTTAFAIKETGFVPGPSASRTFHSDGKGAEEMHAYIDAYLLNRKR